jgi:RNA polymerase sigma-70 factor (ECF subfamily)
MSVVNRAVGADLAEIEAVYRCRLAELQRVATAITGSREAGRDVVQDAFARAVHRRAQFRREGSLEGWIWRIVVTCARDGVRRLAATQSLPLEEGEDAWHAVETSGGEYQEVRSLSARLPERQRLV